MIDIYICQDVWKHISYFMNSIDKLKLRLVSKNIFSFITDIYNYCNNVDGIAEDVMRDNHRLNNENEYMMKLIECIREASSYNIYLRQIIRDMSIICNDVRYNPKTYVREHAHHMHSRIPYVGVPCAESACTAEAIELARIYTYEKINKRSAHMLDEPEENKLTCEIDNSMGVRETIASYFKIFNNTYYDLYKCIASHMDKNSKTPVSRKYYMSIDEVLKHADNYIHYRNIRCDPMALVVYMKGTMAARILPLLPYVWVPEFMMYAQYAECILELVTLLRPHFPMIYLCIANGIQYIRREKLSTVALLMLKSYEDDCRYESYPECKYDISTKCKCDGIYDSRMNYVSRHEYKYVSGIANNIETLLCYHCKYSCLQTNNTSIFRNVYADDADTDADVSDFDGDESIITTIVGSRITCRSHLSKVYITVTTNNLTMSTYDVFVDNFNLISLIINNEKSTYRSSVKDNINSQRSRLIRKPYGSRVLTRTTNVTEEENNFDEDADTSSSEEEEVKHIKINICPRRIRKIPADQVTISDDEEE